MGVIVKCRAGHGPSRANGETVRGLARRFTETGTVGVCPAREGQGGDDGRDRSGESRRSIRLDAAA